MSYKVSFKTKNLMNCFDLVLTIQNIFLYETNFQSYKISLIESNIYIQACMSPY
jgi:hypothetical protein